MYWVAECKLQKLFSNLMIGGYQDWQNHGTQKPLYNFLQYTTVMDIKELTGR